MGLLREQIDVSSSSRKELQSANDEVKSLKHALESASAERERDFAAIQSKLANALKDLDKWRQTANKYEREIENLQRDLQQQSKQWQKTAEIQGTATQLQKITSYTNLLCRLKKLLMCLNRSYKFLSWTVMFKSNFFRNMF